MESRSPRFQNGDHGMKVCLAASAGGHLTQLLRVSESWQGHDVFFVTTTDVVRNKLKDRGDVYVVGECNREHPLRVIAVFRRCLAAVFREHPDVVISTGAAPGMLICLVAKLLGAKIVWLDSIANTERLSMSGRMIRPFADLILSQWPEVADLYSNVEYVGEVI